MPRRHSSRAGLRAPRATRHARQDRSERRRAARWFHDQLARNLRDGDWRPDALRERASTALGADGRWLGNLVARVTKAWSTAPPRDVLAAWLAQDGGLSAARRRYRLQIRRWFVDPTVMGPCRVPGVEVPPLPTVGAVATWLRLLPSELDWFADLKERTVDAGGALAHYAPRWHGDRLVEAPRARLKGLQRRVLRELLDRVPPHRAAHGFVAGRSAVSHAQRHVGRRVVVAVDLRSFFVSVHVGRVAAVFRALGYPEPVVAVLAGLCTTATPRAVTDGVEDWGLRRRLRRRHLPQGAPTSPALANLVAHRLDRRLEGLATRWGLTYSRYADDLALSGDDVRADKLLAAVASVVLDEGFELQPRKTRVQRRSQRQQVTGVVVNERLSAGRREVRALRALLHNCVRHGPTSQNRGSHPRFREHLRGRIAHVAQVDPAKGAALLAVFERIVWPAAA
jgi:hypothetical protein